MTGNDKKEDPARGQDNDDKGSDNGKGKQPVLPQAVEEPKVASKMSNDAIQTLLDLNPTLRNELSGLSKDQVKETLRKMDIAELLTGLSVNPKNQKDMASYKFWKTQPVIHFDETNKKDIEDGPIKMIDPSKVSKEPDALIEGFEWATLDLDEPKQLKELYDLLAGHYVEDVNAMFRFNYSTSFLNW